MVTPLFLLLFVYSVASQLPGVAEREQGSGEDPPPTTTVDPCLCEDEVYDESDMDGFIKTPEACNNKYSCKVIVEPKKHHALWISVQEESSVVGVFLYYYNGSSARKDMIYVTNIQMIGDTIRIPSGYGAYLQLNGTGVKRNYWYNSDAFQARFERKKEDAASCPQPVLSVNSTIQSIQLGDQTTAGCAYRLSSPDPIHIQTKCSWSGRVSVQATFANKTESYKWEAVSYGGSLEWDLPPSEVDIHVRSVSYYSSDSCTVKYFTLNYNPCNCSTTAHNLTLNQPFTLSSPGFPRLLCNNLHCRYNFTAPKPPTEGSKVAFVVNALHRSRARGDKLQFDINKKDKKKDTVTLNDHNSNQTEVAVYMGELLEIDYTASSLLSDDHGFIANITAVHIPNECACPDHLNKVLDDQHFTMEIPAHCEVLNCKFTIPNNSSQLTSANRTFRMEVEHYLPFDGEMLSFSAGDAIYEHIHDDELRASSKTKKSSVDYVTNSDIRVQYTRFLTGNTSSENSHFTLQWKWLTFSDCKCAHHHEWAEPTPSLLYSPSYPSRYCPNMNCTYHIEAHKGTHIEMNVTFFETEPFRDYVKVYDGTPDAPKTQVKRLAGIIKKHRVIRTGSNATLVFTSDSSVEYRGFTISYWSVPDLVEETSLPVTRHWLVLLAAVVVMAVMVVAAISVVIYKKRIRSESVQSIANPIYGFSNVHEVLVFPTDE